MRSQIVGALDSDDGGARVSAERGVRCCVPSSRSTVRFDLVRQVGP